MHIYSVQLIVLAKGFFSAMIAGRQHSDEFCQWNEYFTKGFLLPAFLSLPWGPLVGDQVSFTTAVPGNFWWLLQLHWKEKERRPMRGAKWSKGKGKRKENSWQAKMLWCSSEKIKTAIRLLLGNRLWRWFQRRKFPNIWARLNSFHTRYHLLYVRRCARC